MKFLLLLAIVGITATAHASEKIDYVCDEVPGTVTVAFEDNKPSAIYGISDDLGLSEQEYENQAREALADINLRVSKYKKGIIFTLVTDDHEGEKLDVRCKRK